MLCKMDTIRDNKSFLIVLFLISAILIISGSFFDLSFSEMVFVENQWFSVLMEAICFIPIYLPITLFFFLLSIKSKNTWQTWLFVILTALSVSVVVTVGFSYVHKRGIFKWLSFPVYFPLVFLLFLFLFEKMRRHHMFMKDSVFSGLLIISIAGIMYLLYELAIVHLLKALAGRPRYSEILMDGTLYFVPWFDFSGQGGNSFPSGHASTFFMFCTCLVIIQACYYSRKDRPYNRRTQILFKASLLLLLVFAAMGAYSRVYLSQHFLSDVCVGSIIGFTTPFLMFYLCRNKILKLKNEDIK